MRYKREPSYLVEFAYWLNRSRVEYRKARIIELGVGIANGNYSPSLDYYIAITNGEGEARLLKARADAARNSGD